MTVSLKVADISKYYGDSTNGVEVLRGISFEVQKGESVVIMGPSGSGKSTLQHLLGTLDKPSSGQIEIEGANPAQLSEPELARFRNRVIGFVFQDHYLLPQYDVLENVLIPTFAFSERDQSERARQLLERVGLSHRIRHRPYELSGGERQRVAVARALMHRPTLLLCDEPTGNLDRSTAQAVADLLLQLHAEEQGVLIVVTHSMELASRFPRRYELNEGKLQPAQ
jgi:lipoprotein-releasing system ATP-binding protein